MTTPPHDPDWYGEPDYRLARVFEPLVAQLARYFRAEVKGLQRLPEGAALLVGNHNAGITAPEPLMLGLAYYRHAGKRGCLRFLGHDAMGAIPLVGPALIKLGMIRASHTAGDRALRSGEKVAVYPGGNFEAFRPYSQRHRVTFNGRSGFVKLALRNKVPIVPVLCLGGHETLYVITRGEWLARVSGVKRWLRSDSFPLFLGMPWGIGVGPIFHLPLPAKVLVEVGEPMDVNGADPDDTAAVAEIAHQVEQRLQAMMDQRAAERRFPVLG